MQCARQKDELMRYTVVCAALIVLALGACRSTVAIQSSFDAKPAQAALAPGTNTIKGSAFMRKKTGSIVAAAGEVVYLIPATAYAEERFAKLFPQGKLNPVRTARSTEQTDPEYARAMRQTKADKSGNFEFDKLKAGTYFVSTRVTWYERDEKLPSGGAIYDKVEVKGQNNEVEVIVSGN